MNRTCTTCPRELGPRNKSGLCRSCIAKRNNASPELQQRRKDAITAFHADPTVKAGYRERMRVRNRDLSDAEREKRREHGRRQYRDVLSRPDIQSRTQSAEARAKRGAAVSAAAYRDIPEGQRDEVRRLVRGGMATAAEARAIVAEAVALEKRRALTAERERLAALPLVERQLERVRNGATVSDKPDLRPAGHAYTLGGVASGQL
jgi:hypothetical protein